MIYLEKEREQFEQTKRSFGEAYTALLKEMATVADAKGRVRDLGSPIHHRMSPQVMLSMVQAKSRRVESIISGPEWQQNPELLQKVIEECTDIANYSLFISALCLLMAKEEEKK